MDERVRAVDKRPPLPDPRNYLLQFMSGQLANHCLIPFQREMFRYLRLDLPEESKLGSHAGNTFPNWPRGAIRAYPLLRLPMFQPNTLFIRCIVDTY